MHGHGFFRFLEVGSFMVNKCALERSLVAVPTAVPDDKAIAWMDSSAAALINGWKPVLEHGLDHIFEMCSPRSTSPVPERAHPQGGRCRGSA